MPKYAQNGKFALAGAHRNNEHSNCLCAINYPRLTHTHGTAFANVAAAAF